MTPSPSEILAARIRIRGRIHPTPLRESRWLGEATGVPVALKLECVQRTGSFKIRGAFNALAGMPAGSAVVTASAGNHGRAVALAAGTLRLRAVVFAPRGAPRSKLDAIAAHGAELRLETDYDAAEDAARRFARDTGTRFVSAYNDADVIAGAGTIALELFEPAPDLQTIVVPIGGGGLAGGIAVAAKAIASGIRIVGVEAAASCALLTSVRAGRITRISPGATLADGLAGNLEPGSITFEIVRRHVDDIVTVTEPELAGAIAGLAAHEHVIAEGAGAAAVAAVMARKVGATGPTAVLVTGSNIDADSLRAILRCWSASMS